MMQPVTLGNWKLNPITERYESGYDGDAPPDLTDY